MARARIRGAYNVIAVCKPLMLLWGQTLAFDSNVRYNISGMNIRVDQHVWRFDKWYDTMAAFAEYLATNEEVRGCIQRLSKNKYGEGRVPYGRFLDIYYFIG